MEKGTWQRKARDLILLAAGILALFFLTKTFFFLILPLFLALIFSEGIKKSFRRMKKISPAIRKTLVILMLLILFAMALLCLVLLADRAIRAFRAVSQTAGETISSFAAALTNALERGEESLSRLFHREFHGTFSAMLPEVLKSALTSLVSRAPGFFSSVLSAAPAFLIGAVLFLIATYTLSCKEDAVRDLLFRLFPEKRAEKALEIKSKFLSALKRYARAYLLLFLLTFSESFLGLLILGTGRAFSAAFLIALVDLLPVFGSGTVLLPWAVFSLIAGQTGKGAGLLILYAVIFVIRQFAEPKIVGDQLGMHPVFSLILLVAGLKFFGVWGLIFFPMAGACVLPLIKKEPEM